MNCCTQREDDSPCYECLLETIGHVRELLTKFEQEPVDEMVNYHLVADRIRTALSGR